MAATFCYPGAANALFSSHPHLFALDGHDDLLPALFDPALPPLVLSPVLESDHEYLQLLASPGPAPDPSCGKAAPHRLSFSPTAAANTAADADADAADNNNNNRNHLHYYYTFDSSSDASCSPSAPIVSPLRSPLALTARPHRLRSLMATTLTLTYHHHHSPAATAATMSLDTVPPPGSPPDLTNSKSSKSSSFHSSTLSDIAGPHDISHFEEIALDEPRNALGLDFHGHTFPYDRRGAAPVSAEKRAPRALVSSLSSPSSIPTSNRTAASQSFRDLTGSAGAGKPRYPGLGGSHNGGNPHSPRGGDQPSFLAPNGRSMRRGFTSPSAPSLTVHDAAMRRSRSNSPTQRASAPVPPRSLSRQSSHSQFRGSEPSIAGLSRRQSWQPSRKTAKELEAEYDDDDEVPDDAIIWNVPISPRPNFDRSAPASPAPSALSSAGGSSAGAGAGGSTSALTDSVLSPGQETVGSPSTVASSTDLQNQPLPSPGGESIAMQPDLKTRTKSYTDILSDLDDESRALTEKLEELFETDARLQEERVQKGIASRRSSQEKAKPKPKPISLPLRTGDAMIDPLPNSKEKEKYLSRTRPSWLPPKDPKEEQKHLKQYQEIMARVEEAERKRAQKEKEQQRLRDETETKKANIWEQHVFPHWAEAVTSQRIRELWWRGIPSKQRATAWPKAIGNDLQLSETSYKTALDRANVERERLAQLSEDDRKVSKEHDWFEAIDEDIQSTFTDLKIFQKDNVFHDTLRDVLSAYAMYRSDVGYVKGTNLPAALLLLNLPSADSAFITLANLFNRSLPLGFLVNDPGAVDRTYQLVLEILRYKLPNLVRHLEETLAIPAPEYLEPMFRSLFCRKLDVDTACRIWDIYVFEGDGSLIRAAVGILAALESRLYGSREEVNALIGWEASLTDKWDVGSVEKFMETMRWSGKS